MRTTSYWKLGDRYAYITKRGNRGIVDNFNQVPVGARKRAKKSSGPNQKKAQTSSPKKTGGKQTVTKKKTKKKGGFRLPGGLGPKGILTGALGLMFIPQFVPVNSPGAKMAATGMVLRALKLGGGGALTSVGLITLALEFLSPKIGGIFGGLGGNSGSGGTDY